jgi:hypothetical protein
MNKQSTNRDVQRTVFVESLYNSFQKQAKKAITDYKKFVVLADSYIKDGLDESECIELLMIDGLSREASECYTDMALNKEASLEDNLSEYSFQFEDGDGRLWTSYDIGKTVKAANNDEAWVKTEELLNDQDIEASKVLSVTPIGKNG